MTVANGGMTLYQDMDTDTNWTGEDGISTEEFQQGIASQQWIVAKSGDETATLTLATDMTGAKYIIIPIISTISPFYTLISADLKDGTLNELFTLADQLGGELHRAVAGQWKFNSHCLQFGNNGGTLTLSAFASIDIRCDNSNSGNIRSVLNTYIDAIYFGTGRTISGTTVVDKLFEESNDLDISADVYDGCTLNFEGEIFAQTDVVVSTTLGNSYGETLVFRDAPNTDGLYTLEITGTAHFKNTIKASGTARISLDASGATAFTHESASVTKGNVITYASGQVVDSVVYTDCLSIIVPNTPSACTYAGCGLVEATDIITGGTFNISTGTALRVGDLALADICSFISDGTNHAVELTGVAGSYSWDNLLSNYDVGSVGDGVQITGGSITGNEAIHITATTGTFIINVADTGVTPSVSSAGAIVNVVAGQKTLTLSDLPSGVEVRIRQGSYTIHYTGDITGGTDSYTYTYVPGFNVTISVGGSGYIRETISYTLLNSDATLIFPLKPDPSYLP